MNGGAQTYVPNGLPQQQHELLAQMPVTDPFGQPAVVVAHEPWAYIQPGPGAPAAPAPHVEPAPQERRLVTVAPRSAAPGSLRIRWENVLPLLALVVLGLVVAIGIPAILHATNTSHSTRMAGMDMSGGASAGSQPAPAPRPRLTTTQRAKALAAAKARAAAAARRTAAARAVSVPAAPVPTTPAAVHPVVARTAPPTVSRTLPTSHSTGSPTAHAATAAQTRVQGGGPGSHAVVRAPTAGGAGSAPGANAVAPTKIVAIAGNGTTNSAPPAAPSLPAGTAPAGGMAPGMPMGQ